ncbi:MAG: serine/threonine-protein kinase [Polyangiales bacterium]
MEDAEHARVGSVLLQRYRVDSLLGRGGMSTVYRGVQLSVKRPVAIKLIAGSLASESESVQRFRREAEAMAQLRHPNTVRIYEFGVTEQSELFIVMELLEGHDLAEHLRDHGPFPVAEALSIARQALESLCEAHSLNIVHRDLKPANIFLTQLPRGRVLAKLMDFGIANIDQHAAATKITRSGTMMGTPAYMSPEQAQGKLVDARSDLYSLGVTLFEMLTGQAPFDGQTTAAVLMAHVTAAPPRLRDIRPDVAFPESVQAFVDRLMSKQPDQRPPSSEECLSELETLLEAEHLGQGSAGQGSSSNLGSAAHNANVWATTRARFAALAQQVQATLPALVTAARKRPPIALAALGAVLLLTVAGVSLWQNNASEPEAGMPVPRDLSDASRSLSSTQPLRPDDGLREVRIVTAPSGASVRLNGVELGRTPYELQFRNTTEITLQLPEYQPETVVVTTTSEPNLAVELQPLGAPLRAARPAEAGGGSTDESQFIQSAHDPTPSAAGGAPRAAAAELAASADDTHLAALRSATSLQPRSARERRAAMLQNGAPYHSVLAARRARQLGRLDDDLYRDVVWVLRTQRNERIDALKASFRRGELSRTEYNRRADAIESEFAGR